jgi:hypothetical protein
VSHQHSAFFRILEHNQAQQDGATSNMWELEWEVWLAGVKATASGGSEKSLPAKRSY